MEKGRKEKRFLKLKAFIFYDHIRMYCKVILGLHSNLASRARMIGWKCDGGHGKKLQHALLRNNRKISKGAW